MNGVDVTMMRKMAASMPTRTMMRNILLDAADSVETLYKENERVTEAVLRIYARAEKAEDAVARVRRLHAPHVVGGRAWCMECVGILEPCATIRALDGQR